MSDAAAYEQQIQSHAAIIGEAQARMQELDQFIEKHGTIGTDEANLKIREQYMEYESLVKKCEDAKAAITSIAETASWSVSFAKDFTFELNKGG